MIQTSKRFLKRALAATAAGALALGVAPQAANAETIEPGQSGSVYSSPMVNWTSIGIPRQQTDGSMVAEGSGFTNRQTVTNAEGVPVATGTGAKFAYNYQNVELTIESEWQTASTSASPTALQVNMAEGYYDSYKDNCLSAGGYAAGQVVTCDAKRLVTYTFSEPVWFPKFANIYTTSGLRDAQNNIELVQFEEMKVVSINDGTKDRSSSEYNGGDLPFYPTYRTGGYSEWFTDGVDAQGNYINTLDLKKYAPDATGFNRYTGTGAAPGSNENASAFPQFGVPGFVKSITLEYTPKILVNDPTVVDEWNAGVTRTVGNAGAEITLPLKDLLDWNTEGSDPRQFRYGAYLPRTDYTVLKDFTESDGVTSVTEPAAPGSEVYFNVSVANTGTMNSWGYVALDDMPDELDPDTVELVRVESTQGDQATNTYVGTEGGKYALATAGTKVEVVDGTFRVFRVGADYQITGGNAPVSGTPDYDNGTNIGRVSPKDPTNTTKLPTGGLDAGAKDTYVFKAKLKNLADLKALGTGLCDPNADVVNKITAYDSVVNPNDAATDDANLVVCPEPAPDFEFDKSTDFTAAGAEVGDTVTYTFKVTNTGNMDLSSFEITDPLPGLSEISYPADRSLAVGESKEATATYVLTQADFDAGQVLNVAKASVVPFDPTPEDSTDDVPPPAPKTDEVEIPLTEDPTPPTPGLPIIPIPIPIPGPGSQSGSNPNPTPTPTPTPTPAPNQPGKAVSTAPSQAAGPAKGVSRTLANTGVQVTGILGASALLLAAGAALVVQRNRKQNG
ncbi:DUF11 domain-containing protein [Corynebacterium sp. 153RC1]|uniref:DUF11 domain-containing protein n=1 Tax=Corynebacterium sp. 153RC1 TaxID=2968466 RepID=UPI00211C0522|nr:DUF11 domain-containing protein [Corynebacterium sp. 153RC1]MCQ9361653.1 DUF11 domain-containing protein [Corynebacterium sp. 153RC1]